MTLRRVVRIAVLTFVVSSLLIGKQLMAQAKDAGLWTSVNFEAKLVKKLTFNISEEFRFNENVSELGMTFTDAGLEYKINKHFQVSANYRFIQKRRVDDYYSFRLRYYAAVKYSKKIKPFELTYRLQLLDEYEDIGRASDGGVPIYYLRNKLGLKWDTETPFTPYFSVELFTPLNYPRNNALDGIRTIAGVEYKLAKHHELDFFYLIDKGILEGNPETNFVIGIGYYYKL
jgi:hypothetical protein